MPQGLMAFPQDMPLKLAELEINMWVDWGVAPLGSTRVRLTLCTDELLLVFWKPWPKLTPGKGGGCSDGMP